MADEDNDIEIKEEPAVVEQAPQKFKDLDLDEILNKYPAEEAKEGDKEEAKEEEAESKEEEKVDNKAKEEEDLKEAEKEIEGYFADEGLEDETEEEVTPTLPSGEAPRTPQEQLAAYVYDNLNSINVSGLVNGKPKTISVKVAEELPDDFQFGSIKDQSIFLEAVSGNAVRAQSLAQQFLNNQQQNETQRFTNQERRDIASDIAKLQREGEIPTFTPGVNVDDDPRAETAREVLKFLETENARRLQAANNNERLFNRLSFEDAYYIWKSRNNKTGESQKAEDAERKQIASRQPKQGRGSNPSEQPKRVNLPSTAGWDQIINESLKIY